MIFIVMSGSKIKISIIDGESEDCINCIVRFGDKGYVYLCVL